MTPQRWQIIKDLFLEAQDLPPEQREHFLVGGCGDDKELLREVLDLISQSPVTASEAADPNKTAWEDMPSPEPAMPETIGPYRILRPLGEGGMGMVYLAERTDPILQTVAIKVIRPGMDSRGVLARFQVERQTLAMMSHPNIARVLDAGVTEGHRPYFVMEYVPGEPITRFCDKHELSTRQRLELFVQACAAITHAHQKAILHRDLKPSNLLVMMQDDKPLLKVIDFGVAKAIGGAKLTKETFFTEHGMLVGTPAYMSPEQADAATSGEVDTRSDVYSLGVVLYELLSGALPFDPSQLKQAAVGAMLRIIRDDEPPRPSTKLKTMGGPAATEIARLRHMALQTLEAELRRELEWIPLKAMRKEPDGRYRSAIELADDIGHYLSGRPLIAGPESMAYRLRKLLRRNRATVATAAAFLLLLIAGATVSTIGFVRASEHAAETERQKLEVEKKKNEAVAERDNARAVLDFLTNDVLAGARPARIGDARISDTIVRAMIQPAADAVGKRFADKPLVEAAIRDTLAVTFIAIGQSELALPHAEAALRMRRKLLGEDHPDTLHSQNSCAIALKLQGRAKEAEPLFKDALERYRRTLGPDDPDAISALNNYSGVLDALGREKETEPLRKEALERYQRVLGENHPDTISAMNNYGATLDFLGRAKEAEPLLKQALAWRQRVLGKDHPDTMGSSNSYASVLDSLDRTAEAEPLFKETLGQRRRILGDDHPDTMTSMNNYAAALLRLNRADEAEPLFKEALERRRHVFGEDHPRTLESLHNYADVLETLRREAEAEPLLKDVLERRRRVLGADHPATIASLNTYAIVLEELERPAEAEPLLKSALESNQRVLGADHPNTITSLANYGGVLALLGREKEAEPYYAEAVRKAAALPSLGPDHPTTRQLASSHAARLDDLGRKAEAAAVRARFHLDAPTVN